MSATPIYASIENRLHALLEVSRRQAAPENAETHPAITISREFGCEGQLVAEKTRELLQKKTGSSWPIMDRGILDKVTSDRDFADEILTMGEKTGFINDVISTLFNWSSDKDQYRQLCEKIVPVARSGKVIMVGIGAGIITQNLGNCHKFRIVAPMAFKVKGVARRHQITEHEAEKLILKRQKQRNEFVKEFLNKDITDVSLYDVIFNNARNSADEIAEMICSRVLSEKRAG